MPRKKASPKPRTTACAGCGGVKHPDSMRCRKCAGMGRKRQAYAEQLGITAKRLKILGGEQRLRMMSDDARAIMLKPYHYGSKKLDRSLANRGYVPVTPGRVTQPNSGGRRWTA